MIPHFPVSEIYETIQGEGRWSGTPAAFVRFQGCHVGCPWCDTKHTWELKAEDRIAELPAGPRDGAKTWAMLSAEEIFRRCGRQQHVVLTGGEPFEVLDLSSLIWWANDAVSRGAIGRFFQIETSGTAWPEDASFLKPSQVWVTLSPKIGMPGGLDIQAGAVLRANELKWPVGKEGDITRLIDFLNATKGSRAMPIYLQPLSQSEKATRLCIEACMRHGFKLSAQLHKYLDIP